MPNTFAYAMIFLWPIIAILLYKRFDTVTATFWTIVGGYMFLPAKTALDLPLIPSVGKDQIAALSALMGCIFIHKVKFDWFGRTRTQKVLFTLIIVIPFLNVFFNMEPMFNGMRWMPGLSFYDSVSQVMAQYIGLIPFLVGLSIVRSNDDVTKLINLLVIAGLVYAPLVLFEIRMSPQLHTWIYGFFPHNFSQQIRFDGFRAAVFMEHGLLVASFYTICCSAAFIKFKTSAESKKLISLCAFIFLAVILILNKSVGPVLLTIITIAVLSTNSLWVCKKVIMMTMAFFFLYPLLSILGLLPYDAIIEYVTPLNSERAQSLEFRFVNESRLIEHANEKFLIGWGTWARNRLDGLIQDGYWVIVFGMYGAVYFLAFFGLFIESLQTHLFKNHIFFNSKSAWGIGLILIFVLINQLPNSSLSHSWLWLLSGMLAGYFSIKKGDLETSPPLNGVV
jgi:hypothetical protein